MTDHVYKQIELTGTSASGIEDAVQKAIGRAAKTVRNIHWLQVVDTRAQVAGGKVVRWQVTIKAGFTLED